MPKGKGPPARTQYDVDSELQQHSNGGLGGSSGNSKSSSGHSSNAVPGIVEETASQAEGTPKPGSSKESSGREKDDNAAGNVTFAGGLSEGGGGSGGEFGTLSRGMTVSRRTGATNDHIARIKASESKSPGFIGWVLDAMAHIFDDPDPAQLSAQPPPVKGEMTARQKQLEETKSKSKKMSKKNHNAANQPSVQRAKLIYMRRAAVANESLARQRAEDRYF